MSRADSTSHARPASLIRTLAVTPHFSVVLRAAALSLKFAAVFFMAKFLSTLDFGTYGLLAAGVGYATYLIGADYYTFSNRELIRTEPRRQGAILKNQGAAALLTYFAAVPLVAAVFAAGLLPPSLLPWFVALLIVEQMGQESTRLLVALGHPAVAARVLFVRVGLWPTVVVPALWRWPELRELPFILGTWVVTGLLAIGMAAHVIGRSRLGGWGEPVNWAWIRRGFAVAAVFFVGSLALRGLFAVDRFWMEASSTAETLAAYVFYMAIAGALPALLEAGVFTFEYPAMVASYPTLAADGRRRHARRLLLRVGLIGAGYAVAVAFCLPVALAFVGKPEFSKHVFFAAAGVAAMLLYSMGLVPHFGLYALGRDRLIALANVVATVSFVPAVLFLRTMLPVEDAIPAGLCVAFALLFAWKWFAFSRFSPSPIHG